MRALARALPPVYEFSLIFLWTIKHNRTILDDRLFSCLRAALFVVLGCRLLLTRAAVRERPGGRPVTRSFRW